MLTQTNLVIVSPNQMWVSPTQVSVCSDCGGLFAMPGPLFYGQPHSH